MDFSEAMRIAASGMSAQRLRLNLLSSNLANIHTTRSETGGPYRRRDAIFRATNVMPERFEDILSEVEENHLRGVEVERVISSSKIRQAFDPHHPDADADGYVSFPDINIVEEMVDLLQTTRTYEANVQAIKALKSMIQQALNI